jgi:hypothetical protein
MRLVLPLLLAACGPSVAVSSQTPEDFVGPFLDDFCTAAVECGKFSSVDACMADAGGSWEDACTTELQPAWSPEAAEACLEDVAGYICPEDGTGVNEESSCFGICRTD